MSAKGPSYPDVRPFKGTGRLLRWGKDRSSPLESMKAHVNYRT